MDYWLYLGKNEFVLIKAKCLTFDNKCFGVTNGKAYNDPVKSCGQCKFPFKHKNVTHNSCTMADSDGLWCATSVDANLDWQTKGFCTTKTCPFESMYIFFSVYLFLSTDFSINIFFENNRSQNM